jgi:hypothetical protein
MRVVVRLEDEPKNVLKKIGDLLGFIARRVATGLLCCIVGIPLL